MSPVIIYVIHIQIILINLMELKFLYGIILWSLREPSDCVLMSIKAAAKLYFFHFKPVLSSKYKLYCHLNKYYVLECLLLDSRIFQCLGTIDIFCGWFYFFFVWIFYIRIYDFSIWIFAYFIFNFTSEFLDLRFQNQMISMVNEAALYLLSLFLVRNRSTPNHKRTKSFGSWLVRSQPRRTLSTAVANHKAGTVAPRGFSYDYIWLWGITYRLVIGEIM